ncbi:MAG: hypothetical protein JXM73_21460 [Anaerolineae bacterium]|nr:hypothetical protein [Anaerolineae bacterium]
MDKEGFRQMLHARKLSDEQIEASIALAERFELFLHDSGRPSSGESAWAFSELLIQEGQNTEDNYFALARYGRFTDNNDIYVAVLELLDGAEAQANLHRRVGEVFGQEVRDEVFAGIGVSPLGLPSSVKPRFMHPVVERLQSQVGEEECERLLSGCLRDLPDRYFRGERRKYQKAGDIDEYLKKKHQAFVRQLIKCQREGQLFFAQEITDAVVAFVQNDPEIESGRREGDVVYVSKIPYMAKHYLAETDPTLKRYYACHCPWAREAIRSGDVRFAQTFCYCSGGFHKKPWEVIFKRPLEVQVLESVLRGDLRCRFAIHLPQEAIPTGG